MLLRSASAAFQSLSSKPRFAEVVPLLSAMNAGCPFLQRRGEVPRKRSVYGIRGPIRRAERPRFTARAALHNEGCDARILGILVITGEEYSMGDVGWQDDRK